ncbi:MAG TPA: peptide-methionine (S)-S-oxide reductase MsrA [Burkholderiaceae bacterium]|nr:peptide-methionine (S)-S-oxide reductase MsrA [Burkholderiaceae bacterium]
MSTQLTPSDEHGSDASVQTIVLGGGCFWCTEAVFVRVKGVLDVESGYANGNALRYPAPTYEQVCSGQTGYNEVVKLTYDPSLVSTGELLEVFFATHDPTTLNRQGNDVGTQYRSGVYFTKADQQAQAQALIAAMQARGDLGAPVVTEVQPLSSYTPAEAYHQDYFEQHPNQGYCAFVVGPKVSKFMATFRRLLRD